MQLTLSNAVSIDGFIATVDHDTSWVNDWEIFSDMVKTKRVVIMGRKTYEQSGQDFPYDCELNVVMTSDQELIRSMQGQPNCWFTDATPTEVLREVEDRGFPEALLIGGGKLNAAFLAAGLVQEIILDVYPIILGSGIKIFEQTSDIINLEKFSTRELPGGLVQIRYKVQ